VCVISAELRGKKRTRMDTNIEYRLNDVLDYLDDLGYLAPLIMLTNILYNNKIKNQFSIQFSLHIS